MKKYFITFFCILLIHSAKAQNYDIKKLKTISTIWGETYLFHPSIIRMDRSVEWEKQLVEFLPQIKSINTDKEFIKAINSSLLSSLEDPFTCVQSTYGDEKKERNLIELNNLFDYIKITEEMLSDVGSLDYFNKAVVDRSSDKSLVIDLRIQNELAIDAHTNTFFDYLISMIISEPITLGLNVTREHFGWDEYNDWWFYEQRWKLASNDKQLKDNGKLKPFKEYSQEMMQYLPEFKFNEFVTIERPVYFVTNNSFLSYYHSLLNDLKLTRSNSFVINENSGKIFNSQFSLFKKYQFENLEFILNPGSLINESVSDFPFNSESSVINNERILKFIQSEPKVLNEIRQFPFEILPSKYSSSNKEITQEEKILGVIKTWTIVKYFYVYKDLLTTNWESSLEKYLVSAQKTKSDKEYYELIQEMMSCLNDSHVSTFHPSILDYSKIFVTPINFEWIDGKVLVTGIDSSINADINIGDELLSIDGLSISEILEKEKRKISSSNKQGLIATVINPGYFIGASGSLMKLGISDGKKQRNIELPRTTYIFQFMGFGENRDAHKIFKSNIGYLNLALITEASELETKLLSMKNTEGLVIDLRNSYPTADYGKFLQMLCSEKINARIDEVPIVSAQNSNIKQIEITEIVPDTSFSYNKPIVVLIDKTMISRPEDIAIALKALPNTIFVGEQTQGTDGEIAKIHLPGGGETSFTGQRIQFGNGDVFQGIGIIPDVVVSRTAEGVKRNEDEILTKGLEVLRKQ
ncbi:MAG: hypothetical protein JEY96_08940 [Bacteroidales bacterium]|nr:hypothetical protein [Bacteroidales bacterium]